MQRVGDRRRSRGRLPAADTEAADDVDETIEITVTPDCAVADTPTVDYTTSDSPIGGRGPQARSAPRCPKPMYETRSETTEQPRPRERGSERPPETPRPVKPVFTAAYTPVTQNKPKHKVVDGQPFVRLSGAEAHRRKT